MADKRKAAQLLVGPAGGHAARRHPGRRRASSCSAPAPGRTTNGLRTGLDDVDLWVGGLAEVTNLFGGLLGSTFNYVFQNTLEDLQDGDRLYYLDRTPGMNLRTQLEGNSFAELIQRNTDGTNTPEGRRVRDGRLQVRAQEPRRHARRRSTRRVGSSVTDDPRRPTATRTRCSCASPTARSSTAPATPSTRPASTASPCTTARNEAPDRVFGGNDNDTFWGDGGNDVIEGNGGDDVALGGEGNDNITDLDGADVLKGGPGDDSLDGGPGDDILMGGDGQDFTNGGANDNETFGGPGNDFIRPARARTRCSATVATTGSRVAPARTSSRATTARRSSTTRVSRIPATTSSSVRSARTTTTPRAATT